MSPSPTPLVVGIHHPPAADPEALARELADCKRPVELHFEPFKEDLKIRRARSTPPMPAELLAESPEPSAALRRVWAESEAMLTIDLPVEHLPAMPRLRFVQAYSSGVEHLRPDALRERGIVLATAAGVAAVPIAEFVIGRLLEVWKGARELEHMQRRRAFTRRRSRLVAGASLGIVGLGAIGRAVAQRAKGLDMRVLATRRHPERGGSDCVDVLLGADGLPELMAACDAVVLCAPATAETQGLIDAGMLARARPGALLCNVARGSLVDEAALIGALRSGRLGAAILDVTRVEPLPAESPLWDAPNLYLSPHAAASPEAYDERLLALFVENVRRWAAGESPRNVFRATP